MAGNFGGVKCWRIWQRIIESLNFLSSNSLILMGEESCKPTWPFELVNAFTIGEAEQRSMSLYKYFQPTVMLPDPEGPLKKDICSLTIQIVNDKVRTELEKKPQGSRNPYLKLTPAQKAIVGKRAAEHGVTAAIRYFSPRFPDLELKETTV